MGRIRSAWYVLIGRAKTIDQIAAEWATLQATAGEMFGRFNALAARLMKAEKNLWDRNMQLMDAAEPTTLPNLPPGGTDRQSHKAMLRARVTALRGLPAVRSVPDVHGDQGGEIPG